MDSKGEHRDRPTKSTESVKDVGNLVKWLYERAWEAKQHGDKKVAWCMMGTPQEVLLAMDIVPIFPEQYAAACAVKRAAADYCRKAESMGFSLDICGFCRAGIGYAAMFGELGRVPPDAPYGGIPEPDIFMCRSSCDPGYKWFQALHYKDVPTFVFEDHLAPPPEADFWDEKISSRFINFHTKQFKEMVDFLEQATCKKMDWDRLGQIMEYAVETRRLSYEIHQMRKAVPSPMATEDHMACILPFRILTGTKEALDFARKLYQEIRYRVDNKIGAIPNEKYRLMWEGTASWHGMEIYNYLESLGAVCAVETDFLPSITITNDKAHPLETLAKREYWGRQQTPGGSKLGDSRIGIPMELMLDLVKDFHVDGVIMHSVKSCRVLTIGQLHVRQMIEKHLNVPVMVIEGDMADARAYSEMEARNAIDEFMETLAASKKG
jgi:benzoyl-CoA reductase/2-hydroxyglutaryl-CoA dehydratase subunit BcrC/BadD/HgdB